MKAIQIQIPGGPEVLEYTDVPTPTPGPGEVLVRADTIGVGKPDVLIRRGTYRWMPPLPAIPGNEMSGHVEALGDGVEGIAVGQPVLVSSRELTVRGGCYAEYIAVPASALILLPEGVDLEAAVCLPNYQLAWALLHHAARGSGRGSIYLNGAAGGVGSALIQLARLEGMEVIAGASSAAKCEFAQRQGATHTVNYSEQNVVERVLEATAGRGVDVVFDHIAGPSFADNLKILGPWGMVVSYNVLGGLPATDLFAELRANIEKNPAVRCFTMHLFDHDREARRALLQQVLELLAAGRIRPAIFDRLPLAEARRAHELLDGRMILGKLVLKP